MKSIERPPRIVLDTNVLLRSLINPKSFSGVLVKACEARRAICVLSKPLVDEYRRVLKHASEIRPSISADDVNLAIERLRYLGDCLDRIQSRFSYPRDPTDEKLVELAIDAAATHISTFDPDLLSLPTSKTDSGKRFRQRLRGVIVAMPTEILAAHPTLKPAK